MRKSQKLLPTFFLLLLASASEAQESYRTLLKELRETREFIEKLPPPIPSEQTHGRMGLYGVPRESNEVILDLGRSVTPDEVVIFPARLPTDPPGSEGSVGFPPGFDVEISNDGAFARAVRLGRWEEDEEKSGFENPFVRIAGNGASGRFVRVRVNGSRERSAGRGRFFTLGEIVVLEKGVNAALHGPAFTTASIENSPRWQVSNLTDGFLWCLPFAGLAESPTNGYHSRIETTAGALPKWVEVDLGGDFPIDEIRLFPAHPRDFADTAGFGFPSRFRVTGRRESEGEEVLFDSGSDSFPNPGAAVVSIPAGGVEVRHVRFEAAELWQRTNDFIFALAEMQVWSEGGNIALNKPVAALDSTDTGRWSRGALTDGFSSRSEVLSWRDWLDAVDERERLQRRFSDLEGQALGERERTIRFWIFGAVFGSLLVTLAAFLVVVMQRRSAAASQESLKRRIAGDLHDELGASLSHLALQSDLARKRIGSDHPVSSKLGDLSEAARDTLDNMRDVIWLLAPVGGTWRDLESRMENISDRILEGVVHSFAREGRLPAGNPPIELARELVLFLKETLTNARKHASPGRVVVGIFWSPRGVKLEIRDDGAGFVIGSEEAGRGRGLHNLQTRADSLGGRCRIDSSPGIGTTVILEIPLP